MKLVTTVLLVKKESGALGLIKTDHLFLSRYDCDPDESTDDLESWREEEQASLRQSLRTLQTQFASERARREAAERGAELLAGENAALEQRLGRLEGCQVRPMDYVCKTQTNFPVSTIKFIVGLILDTIAYKYELLAKRTVCGLFLDSFIVNSTGEHGMRFHSLSLHDH